MNISTAAQIADWMSGQSRPKKPQRTLFLKPSASDAMKEFTLQYNRLLRQKINSRTAHGLRMAVLKAETAKDLSARLPTKIRDSDAIQDALSGLQLQMYSAANWIRRFADDRHTVGEWVMIEEKRAGHEIAQSLDTKVRNFFTKIQELTNSKTIQDAFQAYEIKWKQQDVAELAQAAKDNAALIAHLSKEWKKFEKHDASTISTHKKMMFLAYCAELDDSRQELTADQRTLVNTIKASLKNQEEEAPAWRTQGIKTLGPFGIAANIRVDMDVDFPMDFQKSRLPGKFTVKGPKEAIEVYEQGLGGTVTGGLSPVFPVTIRQTDPTARLIRIPVAAKFFAFAYPVISGQLEVTVVNKSTLDAFLLYGGFVYFDGDMKLIQVNGLWVGNQLQMSAPKPLPAPVADKLKEAGRFHDITLPQLSNARAKQFAWILPDEFPEISIPHGGWCYLYEDESVNNYFSVASAESVMGLTKAFSLRDFKD